MSVRVLVVEDESITAEIHCAHVERVPGFEVAAVARTVAEAVAALRRQSDIDLVLLDFHLPDGHGLAIVRALRAAGHPTDVIAVTAARESDEVRGAVRLGVVGYLLKPFTFETFRAKLRAYADYRQRLDDIGGTVEQSAVDELLESLRASPAAPLPKGLSEQTLASIQETLSGGEGAFSASEVGQLLGTSRSTARRYLEYLADQGIAQRGLRYGSGRPELEYSWVDAD